MNHDNDYAPNVNHGNQFPDDWYFINEKDSLNTNTLQTQSDYAKCYKPYRTLQNY